LAALLLAASSARGQAPPAGTEVTEPALDDTMEAGEAEVGESQRRRRMVKWNEYEGPYFTIRVGGGALLEADGFSQDEESKQQFALEPQYKVRDARILLKGRFPASKKRAITWTSGIMYDGPTDEFLIRETGIMVEVPEIWGHIFIGRSKEGFSLEKVMNGYSVWTMERTMMNDAAIPILADGIKWLGYVPEKRIIWNLGFYGDWLSKDQSFSSYTRQVVGRFAWLPYLAPQGGTLLHLGISARYGKPEDDRLRLRSRPEASTEPYFVDTGFFDCDKTEMLQVEAYYRPGPWLFGAEYFFEQADAPTVGDPFYHGGAATVAWLITGETRAYNTRGGFFNFAVPAKSVFEGGGGAWELGARVSYIDLDDGPIQGGKFWRITPILNWYLSEELRLHFQYGYGELDRFGVVGATQFFQTRLQFKF
jgi:phosphate-selective porin OprO/OprP